MIHKLPSSKSLPVSLWSRVKPGYAALFSVLLIFMLSIQITWYPGLEETAELMRNLRDYGLFRFDAKCLCVMSKQRSSFENFIRVQLFQGRACRFQRWNGSTPSTQRKSQDKVFFSTWLAQLKLLIWFVALSCDGRSGGGTAQQFLLPSLCAHNHLAGKAGRMGNRLRR